MGDHWGVGHVNSKGRTPLRSLLKKRVGYSGLDQELARTIKIARSFLFRDKARFVNEAGDSV